MKKISILIIFQLWTAFVFASQQDTHVDYLQMFKSKMQKLVLGQPEGVDAFADVEKLAITSGGEREVPEVVMLMGLPGTGKDTLVESYIKTRHELLHNNTERNVLIDHIFNVPKMINETDLAMMTGSKPGYVGSDNMPPLIKWLVKHSAGRYYLSEIVEKGQKTGKFQVMENHTWKPGQIYPGYSSPEDAVLFVNETHDWKKEYVNLFLKEALEKGKFVIGNAKDGLSEIFVPITIVLASNDGIGLIADRDSKGKRIGKPLSEESLMQRWSRAISNPELIKKQIKNMSEEMMSRIPNSRIILLRPVTSENLKKIIRLKLANISLFYSRHATQKKLDADEAIRLAKEQQEQLTQRNKTSAEILSSFKVLMDLDFIEAFFTNDKMKQDMRVWVEKEIKKGTIIPERDQVLHLKIQTTFMGTGLGLDRNNSKKSPAFSTFFTGNIVMKEQIKKGLATLMTFDDFMGETDDITSLDFSKSPIREGNGQESGLLAPVVKYFPSFSLEYSEALVDFLSTYDQSSEDGGRIVNDKIKSIILNTIQDAYFNRQISINENDILHLDILPNADGTFSLTMNGKTLPIHYTQKTLHQESISDARIDELLKIEEQINARVKGVEHISMRIAKSLLAAANVPVLRDENLATKKADLFMFLGVSSTGKTELAKAINATYYKTSEPPTIINFSNIRTYEDVRRAVLGDWDSVKQEPIASKFMHDWDRNHGDFVIVFDEIANANPEVLRALYDILDEPVVRSFTDGIPRIMGKVKIIMTGNAGEEWYKVIPRDVPENEQYDAAQEIYKQAISNPGYLNGFLQKFFTEAFLRRIGIDNIYFFAPHRYENTYALFHLKLLKAMEELTVPREGARTWDITFKSPEEYKNLIDFMVHHQFHLWEQGRSIEKAVKAFTDELNNELLPKAKSRSKVILSFDSVVHQDQQESSEHHKAQLQMQIEVPGQNLNLTTQILGKVQKKELPKNQTELLLTAYHEAGHELVRQVLLEEFFVSEGLKITPGITNINGNMIRYLGLASYAEKTDAVPTLDFFVRRIAVMMGGAVAEALVSKNGVVSAGKSNDIQRATALAQSAILRYGLVPEWGNRALQPNQDIDQFLQTLTPEEKKKYESALKNILSIGESLARKTLIANFDNLFLPIGSELVVKGELTGPEMREIYKKTPVVKVENLPVLKAALASYDKRMKNETTQPSFLKRTAGRLMSRWAQPEYVSATGAGPELYSFVTKPAQLVNVPARLKAEKEAAHAKVDLSAAHKFVLNMNSAATPAVVNLRCAEVLVRH